MKNLKEKISKRQSGIDCLNRILNDQDPYPGIDSSEIF